MSLQSEPDGGKCWHREEEAFTSSALSPPLSNHAKIAQRQTQQIEGRAFIQRFPESLQQLTNWFKGMCLTSWMNCRRWSPQRQKCIKTQCSAVLQWTVFIIHHYRFLSSLQCNIIIVKSTSCVVVYVVKSIHTTLNMTLTCILLATHYFLKLKMHQTMYCWKST